MSPEPLERAVPRVDVLGVSVSAINMEQALDVIDDWITAGIRRYVCVTGVHGVMESRRDPRLQEIHNRAGLVTPDGMPLVWWSKACGWRHTSRVYGPDLMLGCCERSMATGYRHFFYGGDAGVGDLLARRLNKRFPGLMIAGTYTPPFRPLTPQEDEAVVRRINDAGADIVWVGLSTPKQEYWMAEHVGRLDAPVLIGVGAAFDFHAGLKRQAPVWMQHSGLEWAFRLAAEPRRLWRRYLRNNPAFVWLALQHAWRSRHGDTPAAIRDPRRTTA
jgi:N-acetylglucosaminyldiphosphoundecaprenol N-acetyl-beta-D-mannosaminyltransferase